jgi:hypothetical protein
MKSCLIKLSVFFLFLNVISYKLSAQSPSIFSIEKMEGLVDDKKIEETILENRKDGRVDFYGIYNNCILYVDRNQVNKTDSVKIYNVLITMPGLVSCKLEFFKNQIEVSYPCDIEDISEEIATVKAKLASLDLRMLNHFEYKSVGK